MASQAIYDCKKDKYLLKYNSILRLSALVGLSQLFHQVAPSQLPATLDLTELRKKSIAVKTKHLVVNKFASFEESPEKWVEDYEKMTVHMFNKIK